MQAFAPMSALMIALGIAQLAAAAEPQSATATVVTEEMRKELLAARDRAWRSFFDEDPVASIRKILGPEVIAIQESHEKWENRESLIAMAKSMKAQNIRVMHL